ncbi:hypothetical protein [Planctomicrobium sp. SH664]|uniref:hypothetical protein n=1 Tax=Planctomicrobium sp. SH664 TaxID=3448125 RepID=UPI003F5BF99C
MPSQRLTLRLSLQRLLTGAVLSLVGCATFQDSHYEHTQQLKTHIAWWRYKACLEENAGSDFARGWKAGYLDVVTGGTGKAPMVPPHHYWKPGIVGDPCDTRRLEWYSGWEEGALMASLRPNSHYINVWNPPSCQPIPLCELPTYLPFDPAETTFTPDLQQNPTPVTPGKVDNQIPGAEPMTDPDGLPIPPMPPATDKKPDNPADGFYFPPQESLKTKTPQQNSVGLSHR